MTLCRLVIIAAAILSAVFSGVVCALAENAPSQCGKISPRDAEILIYLLPVAEQLRGEGIDIGWERAPLAEGDKRTDYVFWVYNSKRKGTTSVTIGYYRVNKCTGIVTEDETEKVVSSRVLDRVRLIMINGEKGTNTNN